MVVLQAEADNAKLTFDENISPDIICLKEEVKKGDFVSVPSNDKSIIIIQLEEVSSHTGAAKEDTAVKEEEEFVNKERLICGVCGRLCNSKQSLEDHTESHRRKKKKKYIPKETKKTVPVDGLYSCPLCPKQFKVKRKLWKHKSIKHGKVSYDCNMCNKSFHQKSNLERHLKVHDEGHEERKKESRELRKKVPLVKSCTVCDPEVKVPNNVKNHYLRHHRVSSLFLHPCPNCWEWFPTTDDLKNHMTFHTGQLNMLSCNLCTFTVAAKLAFRAASIVSPKLVGQKSMDAHLDIHQNGIICKHCAKLFKDTNRLSHHLKTHQEKSVICTECGAIFKENKSLRVHTEIKHTQSLNYCCDVCEKRFPTARYLNSHKERHKNLNPHTCEMCGKFFKTRGDMKCHYRRMHTDKPKYRKQIKKD